MPFRRVCIQTTSHSASVMSRTTSCDWKLSFSNFAFPSDVDFMTDTDFSVLIIFFLLCVGCNNQMMLPRCLVELKKMLLALFQACSSKNPLSESDCTVSTSPVVHKMVDVVNNDPFAKNIIAKRPDIHVQTVVKMPPLTWTSFCSFCW